jgi:NADH:ubiquinone oxidoreductase subunit 4 (subunit M)
MVFAAMYLLIMVGKVVFGPLRVPGDGGHADHDPHDASAMHASTGATAPTTNVAEGGGAVTGAARKSRGHAPLPADLSFREVGVLVPLAILCVVLGVQPGLVMNAINGSVVATLSEYVVMPAIAVDADDLDTQPAAPSNVDAESAAAPGAPPDAAAAPVAADEDDHA